MKYLIRPHNKKNCHCSVFSTFLDAFGSFSSTFETKQQGKSKRILTLPNFEAKTQAEYGFPQFSPIFTDGRDDIDNLDKMSASRGSTNPNLDFCQDLGALSQSILPIPGSNELSCISS